MKIICVLIAALMCLSSTVVLADASQATGTAADTELDATWKLVQEAYIYSFPLVLMSATEAKMTNVEEPDALQGPVNTINHAMQLANADSRNVVTPNVDTIYSQIWLDLSDDAVVFHKPAVDRFCSVQVLDATPMPWRCWAQVATPTLSARTYLPVQTLPVIYRMAWLR